MRAHLWCVDLYHYDAIPQDYTTNPNNFYAVYLRHHNATTENALDPTKRQGKNETLLQQDPKSASRIREESKTNLTARKQL